jgi:predicted helicase
LGDLRRSVFRWSSCAASCTVWSSVSAPPPPSRSRRRAEAFVLRKGEVIATAKDLAARLADLARRIRRRARLVMKFESERGPLRRLHKAFREALIHDLTEDDFADMYAQTITYGLFSAAVSRPAGVTADTAVQMVPGTNPFLRDMMGTFLTAGGRREKLNFDELDIQEVVDLLNSPDTHMADVLRDFDNRNPQEYPIIHFYEHFLAAYDKEKKVSRGVFYTPKPVVSYIVRSVDELLRTEFGLEDGLASTATWREMAAKHTGLKIPDGVRPDSPFVQILDPATGTATFLVEVIDVIHRTLAGKWEKGGAASMPKIRKGKSPVRDFQDYWNRYVPEHLLPRLHGYELMMAPYAIAHMKLPLKLKETGFTAWDKLGKERARIYLTNALEPASDDKQMTITELTPALAHEARAVNAVKRNQRFTVVIGNPPYSAISANLTPQNRRIVDRYRSINGLPIRERSMLQFEKNIQDDYVKFIAISQSAIEASPFGVVGLVTNHSYLDGPTLRGMRWNLLQTFSRLDTLDLHGNICTVFF